MRADGITDADGNCDGDSYSYSYANSYSYGYINAKTDAHAEVCANSEASSHAAAQTVVVFAKANIVATGDERSVLTDVASLRVHAARRAAQSSHDARSR